MPQGLEKVKAGVSMVRRFRVAQIRIYSNIRIKKWMNKANSNFLKLVIHWPLYWLAVLAAWVCIGKGLIETISDRPKDFRPKAERDFGETPISAESRK